jgi:hypothetical protein
MKKLIFLIAISLFAGVAIGQTLKKGAVIAVRSYTVTLQPDVTMNQYLDFYLNKYIPAFEENMPGLKMYVLIGDRGAKKNQMGEIWYFESREIRNKYWPTEEGEGSDEVKAALDKMKPIVEEFSKYLLYQTEEFTDWIIK